MNDTASTCTFPTEIVLHIAKYLPSLDILALSLVSKSFRSCASLLTSDRTEIFKRTEKLNRNSLIRLASLLAEANKYGRELARYKRRVELNLNLLLESSDPGSPRYQLSGSTGFPYMLDPLSPTMFDEALVNVVADVLTNMAGIEELWIDMDPIYANHLPFLAQFFRQIQTCLENVAALEIHNYRPRCDPQNTDLPPNSMELIINMLNSSPNLKTFSLDKVDRFDQGLEQALSKCTGMVKLTLAVGEFSSPHSLSLMISSWPILQTISLSVNHAAEDVIPNAVDLITKLCPLIHSVHLTLPTSGIHNNSGQRVLDAICRLIERHPGGLRELSVARLPNYPYTAQLRVIATACPNLEMFSLTSRHPHGVVGERITQINWPRMRQFNIRVYELPVEFLKAVLTQTPCLEDAQFTLGMTPSVEVLKEAGFVLEGKKNYCGDNYWSYRRGKTTLKMNGRWDNATLEDTMLSWKRDYSGTLNNYMLRT